MHHTGTVTLSIDSRLENVFLVGLSVRAICAALPLAEETAHEVELCVVEAVNNAIEHAYREEPGHPVDVVVTVEHDRLTIAVCDRGERMCWRTARQRAAAASREPLAEGGRGLFIIESLMDRVTYESRDGRNVLTLVKESAAISRP